MHRPAIYIGFDQREADAFMVAKHSIKRFLLAPIPIYGIVLANLQERGLYTRPTRFKTNGDGRPEMIDELSIREDYDGRISTQHALARFLVPHIHGSGLALFVDGDILLRANITELFRIAHADKSKALWCVKHDYKPSSSVKMDGQEQTIYARKNWSSCMLFNVDNPANKALTLELINTLPGRDLHRICWLDDSEIGDFGPEWNWLVGQSSEGGIEPKLIHFTNGTPSMPGYESSLYADLWRRELSDAAQGALSLPG